MQPSQIEKSQAYAKAFLYTLYITHCLVFCVVKIVQISFDILKKKALPL